MLADPSLLLRRVRQLSAADEARMREATDAAARSMAYGLPGGVGAEEAIVREMLASVVAPVAAESGAGRRRKNWWNERDW